jgi:2-alkyl-3-oxoalkanoate reductase
MRVLVAGATGAMGKQLVPALLASGHQVVAMTRSAEKAAGLAAAGTEPVVADGLDRAAVVRAVTKTAPEVIIHQMTGLARMKSLKEFDAEFGATNRLRTEGTDNLLAAARAAGVRRIVAQSYGNWNYERTGTTLKTEEDRFDPDPPANQRQTLKGIEYVERAVTEAGDIEGVALRYGNFYGPGTGISLDGDICAQVRRRMFPVVGDGAGVWSFTHIADAATAAIAAAEGGAKGVYNICDDDPAPVAVWLPELARSLGAKPPRRVPVWLGRLIVGDVGVSMMTRIRGVSNGKAKQELRWKPRYQSWRDGFRYGLGEDTR